MSDAVKPPEALPYLPCSPDRHRPGPVHLVGAGPGDTELLTLAAVRAIKHADVILYDHLVGPGVLEFARRDAERIPVGKRAGRHSMKQTEINALLLEHACHGPPRRPPEGRRSR